MTKEEGKGKNNKQGGGHPPKQRSVEEEEGVEKKEIRPNNNIQRHRDYRAKKKCEFISLQKQQELFMKFCDEKGITEELEAFREKQEEEEEKQGNLCKALGEASEALLEDLATQKLDKETQKILKNFAKNPWATLEENLESEMIQTGRLEGVTAMNSSSLGAVGAKIERAKELKRKRGEELDGACRGKRPAIAYTTPSRPPIGGFMTEACQNYGQSVAALATQGPLLSTDKGTEIRMREATHDGEASTSSLAPPAHHELGVSMDDLMMQYGKLKDAKRRQQEAAAASVDAYRKFKEKKKEADNLNGQVKELEEGFGKLKAELAEKGRISKDALDLQMIDAVTLGWNLMKELLQSMQPGSEFLNLRLLDTIQLYPSLQNQFNEGLTLMGQGHPIDDKVAMQFDDPPVVVPRSLFWLCDWLESVAWGPNAFAPQGDAANIAANNPQFQAANARANNVEQEDDANDQRMDEPTEADNLDWMQLRSPDGGGEDP